MADSPGDARERVLFEGQRVFIILNAAGALALLVFLNAIWLQAGAVSLKRFVLYGIAAFAAGVGVAMLGYVVRYWTAGRVFGPHPSDRDVMDSVDRRRVLRGGAGPSGRRRPGYAWQQPAGAPDADYSCQEAIVIGWVERSETRQRSIGAAGKRWVSQGTQPIYGQTVTAVTAAGPTIQ